MKLLLPLAELPRSTFYYYLRQLKKPEKYQMVKESIVTIFHENKKRYGYRRITQELHNNGLFVNHKTVQKLMRQLGLVCQVRARKKYNSYISYSLSRHPNFKQITDMLESAFQKLPDKVDNLILHSDQGWQYQMKPYQRLLKAKGITQSMSRKATCLDNAVAENFFGLLKTELFYLEKFTSIDQLEMAIVAYIDYYNNRRIKLKLNGLSPVQYRIQTVHVA